MREEEARSALTHLRGVARRVYLHTDFQRCPAVGVHAALLKFPTDRFPPTSQSVLAGEPSSRLHWRDIRRTAARRWPRRDALSARPTWRPSYLEMEPTVFETVGYWNRLEIEYVDEFSRMIETPLAAGLEGQRSHYGYVLATNSGVVRGRIVARPLVAERGANAPAVFAHYKLNPFLLFTGRADLVTHLAQFIALLCEARAGFWRSAVARTAWRKALDPLGEAATAREARIAEVEGLVERLRRAARGVQFLVYQNLGWDDMSVYLVGGTVPRLASLALFLRELPVFFARFPSRVKRLIDDVLPEDPAQKLFGPVRDKKPAQDDVDLLAKLLERCESGRGSARSVPVRQHIPELPVFCDYTDVYTRVEGSPPGVLFVQDLKVEAGSADLLVDGALDRPTWIRSGPIDLRRDVARVEQQREARGGDPVYSRRTIVLATPDETLLYRRRHRSGPLADAVRALLGSRFDRADWDAVERLLRRLEAPVNLRHALRNLVLSHLAYKDDPVLVNTLIGYFDLWRNLQRQLPDELRRREKSPRGGELERKLTRFLERVGQGISGRYHSSSRMFEVADLNPNHRGGIDLFINAYQELVHLVISTCRHVEHEPLEGVVNVGYGNVPQVEMLFGTIVELDWLRLSAPESGFIILHELGHHLLRDPVLRPLLDVLDDTDHWSPITDLADYESLDPDRRWSSYPQVREVFADVFCDAFTMAVIRASCPPGAVSDQELQTFYDRWFWAHAEMALGSSRGSDDAFLFRLVTRWYCVRGLVEEWGRDDPSMPQSAAVQAMFDALIELEGKRRDGTLDAEGDEPAAEPPPRETDLLPPLVDLPADEREWWTLLERHAARYSITLRRRLHPGQPCAMGAEGARARARCEQACRRLGRPCFGFWSDAYGVLDGYLRPFDDQRGNAAQQYLHLVRLVLREIVPEGQHADLQPVFECFRLEKAILDRVLGDPKAEPYVSFDEDGAIEPRPSGRERYAPMVINRLGSVLILDPDLRQAVANRRIELFLRLANARLRRLGDLLDRS